MRVSAPEIKWTSDNPPLLITAEKAIYEEMWKAQTMGGHPSEQQEYFVKPIFRVEVRIPKACPRNEIDIRSRLDVVH